MAYNPMTPKATGDIPNENDWNQIVDNFVAGIPDIFTTKGDIAIASAADVAGRLGVGSDGQVLIADSSEALGVKWGAIGSGGLIASAKVSSTKAVPTATATLIDFDTVIFDDGSDVTTGASWKYTAPSTGYYFVQAAITLESSASWEIGESLMIQVFKNGASIGTLAIAFVHAAGTFQMFATGSMVIALSATDYIDIRVTQDSDVTINVAADGAQSYVSIAKLF